MDGGPDLCDKLSSLGEQVLERKVRNSLSHVLKKAGISNGITMLLLPWQDNSADLTEICNLLRKDNCIPETPDNHAISMGYLKLGKIMHKLPCDPMEENGPPTHPLGGPIAPILPANTGPPTHMEKPSYVRRATYMASIRLHTPSSTPTPSDADISPVAKRGRPTISRTDPRSGPFAVALSLAEGSSTLALCLNSTLSDLEVKAFILSALSNRCKTEKTLRAMATMVAEFIKFATESAPPKPFFGTGSLLSIQQLLVSLRDRGESIPRK